MSDRRERHPETVSASDVGTYTYCARAYRLQKVEGRDPSRDARERMQRGTKGHHAHGVAYDWQRRLLRWAGWLLGAGIGGGALWWVLTGGP